MSMLLYDYALALLAPFLLLAIAVVFGLKAGVRARGFQISAAALPLSLALHPLVQPLYLEARDQREHFELARRLEQAQLIGKPGAAVTAVLGEPSAVRSETPRVYSLEGRMVWEGETRTVWEYKPLPYYWSGRRLLVYFTDGFVSEFRANAG